MKFSHYHPVGKEYGAVLVFPSASVCELKSPRWISNEKQGCFISNMPPKVKYLDFKVGCFGSAYSLRISTERFKGLNENLIISS